MSRDSNNIMVDDDDNTSSSSNIRAGLEVYVTEMVGCNSTAQTSFSSNALHSNNIGGGSKILKITQCWVNILEIQVTGMTGILLTL